MNTYVKMALGLRPSVQVVHHIPGRIRLKYSLGILAHVAALKQLDITDVLRRHSAFRGYKLNVSTNSVLVEYDAAIIKPEWVDGLFSDDDMIAEDSCYALAGCLKLGELTNE